MKRYKQFTKGKVLAFPKNILYFLAPLALCLLLIFVPFSTAYAQIPTSSTSTPTLTPATISTDKGVPVLLGGEKLFNIRTRIGAFLPEERAQAVSNRLLGIAKDPTIQVEQIAIDNQQQTTNLIVGNRVLLTITDADAKVADQTRQMLAKSYLEKIQKAVTQYRIEHSPAYLRQGFIKTIVATVVLLGTLILFALLFPRLYTKINALESTRIPALRFQINCR